MSEPGRQAFWFLILLLSLVSCQAGLAFSFLGATLRPALDNHDVLLDHYGQRQAILNVGKAGEYTGDTGRPDRFTDRCTNRGRQQNIPHINI